MSKGRAISDTVARPGQVSYETAGQWNHIYRVSLVKDAKYDVGDHFTLPDGREYVYSRAAAACLSGQGCEFTYSGYSAYANADVAQAVGDTQVSISAAATHAVIAKDGLKGGYVVMHNATLGANAQTEVRGIIGNDAVATADSGCVLYLDGALSVAVVIGTTGIEVFENPYAALQTGTMNYYPKAGVPASYVSTALMYFWCQIKGPCFVAPQGGKLGTGEGGYVGGMWSDVGNVSDVSTSLNGATVPAGRGTQYAGHALLGDADNIGPLFMLQG